MIIQVIVCCILGYLLGNLSPSYIFGKAKGYDVRKDGSGNAGASNAFILLGARAFFLTAAVDILKAFAAFRLCGALFPDLTIAAPLGGAFCVIGHIFPVALRFHGGKGLACLGGVILAWSWQWFLIFLAAALVIAFSTRYVCLVAPTLSIVFPVCYYFQERSILSALIFLAAAVPVISRHWENFVHIKDGTEMRTSFIFNKEKELKRIGRWNPTTQEQLKRRGK